MSRKPTKAINNPFCKARYEAAKYNEKFYSKDYAAEMLNLAPGTIQSYELGLTKSIPPDNVIRMADLYNAPELTNYYCREVCPIGESMPKLDIESLDRITIKALAAFKKIDGVKEKLLDITEDGVISPEERPDLEQILRNLDEITYVAMNLKAWVQKNLRRDEINE